ncbi:MAG: hypothetical protein H0T09_02450 [Actinobacteria bacterium]|nr:hypothetical protein [Actinomycetota bacterium]
MIRALAVFVTAFATLAAGTASAATPTDKKIAALQKQTAALQKQVKALQKTVKDLDGFADFTYALGTCQTAITADALQGTWAVVNQVAGRAIFPAAVNIPDDGACNALRISRQPTVVPPTISPFSALAVLLTSRVPVEPLVFP